MMLLYHLPLNNGKQLISHQIKFYALNHKESGGERTDTDLTSLEMPALGRHHLT